jgi:hypothetical protein
MLRVMASAPGGAEAIWEARGDKNIFFGRRGEGVQGMGDGIIPKGISKDMQSMRRAP